MTSKSPSFTTPVTQARHLEIDAQRLRAEAMAEVIVAVGRGLARLFAPIFRFGLRTAESVARQREVEQIYRELSRMTDRDLADIGLTRSDISAVAEGTFRRETASVVELHPAASKTAAKRDLPQAA